MQFNYYSTKSDQSYLGRVFLLVKRNYWLFLPDIIIFMILIFPPYTLRETYVLIGLLLILLVRDIILLKLGVYHISKFLVKGNDVNICILRKNKIHREINEWLPDIELEVKYINGMPILFISKRNEVLFKQYPIGRWSAAKMKEFVDSFYDYKKEQAMWKIFKGQ